MRLRDAARARFNPSSSRGHYESWFVRANHPNRPLALWFRYTVFAPARAPERATAELWGIWFDGERHAARRIDVPLAAARFQGDRALDLEIGDARLALDVAGEGEATGAIGDLSWALRLRGGDGPIRLLPARLYAGPFPRAKSIVLAANTTFDGVVRVDREAHRVDGWRGSVNHNWGTAHTDAYAWCQVAGFDDAPDSFLEIITGDVRIAGVRLPRSTIAVLHHEGRTHHFDSPLRGALADARYDVGTYRVRCENADAVLDAEFSAPPAAFVGLTYRNPPHGTKVCHNCKLAGANVTLLTRGGRVDTLRAEHRAAFEVLLDQARVPLAL